MDGDRFDALTKAFGSSAGRRGLLVGLLGGTLGGLLGTRATEAGPKKARRRHRKGDRGKRRSENRAKPHGQVRPSGPLVVERKKRKKKKKAPRLTSPPVAPPEARVLCPQCGDCQTCVLGGDGCEAGCAEPCLARGLCDRANAEVEFRRLAAHLANAGFASAAAPEAFAVADAEGPLRAALATRYSHGSQASESAVLWYVEESAGDKGSYVVIHRDGVPDHGLVVAGGTIEPLAFEEDAAPREGVQAAGVSDWFTRCGACEGLASIGLDHPCGVFMGIVCGLVKRHPVGLIVCAAAGKWICEHGTGDASESLCRRLYCCEQPCVYQENCCQGECCTEGQVCCGDKTCCDADECCDGRCGLCGGVCCVASQCRTCVDGNCRGGCQAPGACGRTPAGTYQCVCPSVAFERCPDPDGIGPDRCCDTRAPLCHRCEDGVCRPKCQPPKVCRGELIPTCECPEDQPECDDTCCGANQECCNDRCLFKQFGPYTPCGDTCCRTDVEECCNGRCLAKASGPWTPCGTICCGPDLECCGGQCRDKESGPWTPCGTGTNCCARDLVCCNGQCLSPGTIDCGDYCCFRSVCCGSQCCPDDPTWTCKSGCNTPNGRACCKTDSTLCCPEGE